MPSSAAPAAIRGTYRTTAVGSRSWYQGTNHHVNNATTTNITMTTVLIVSSP